MVAHAYNSGTWEAEVGGLQVPGQPELSLSLSLSLCLKK
jgi:hypothetical protein